MLLQAGCASFVGLPGPEFGTFVLAGLPCTQANWGQLGQVVSPLAGHNQSEAGCLLKLCLHGENRYAAPLQLVCGSAVGSALDSSKLDQFALKIAFVMASINNYIDGRSTCTPR